MGSKKPLWTLFRLNTKIQSSLLLSSSNLLVQISILRKAERWLWIRNNWRRYLIRLTTIILLRVRGSTDGLRRRRRFRRIIRVWWWRVMSIHHLCRKRRAYCRNRHSLRIRKRKNWAEKGLCNGCNNNNSNRLMAEWWRNNSQFLLIRLSLKTNNKCKVLWGIQEEQRRNNKDCLLMSYCRLIHFKFQVGLSHKTHRQKIFRGVDLLL